MMAVLWKDRRKSAYYMFVFWPRCRSYTFLPFCILVDSRICGMETVDLLLCIMIEDEVLQFRVLIVFSTIRVTHGRSNPSTGAILRYPIHHMDCQQLRGSVDGDVNWP